MEDTNSEVIILSSLNDIFDQKEQAGASSKARTKLIPCIWVRMQGPEGTRQGGHFDRINY